MKQLKIRLAGVADASQIIEWLNATAGNLYDPDVLGYPTLKVLCSYDGDGAVAYLPMQAAAMLESLAVKPGLEPIAAAQAFRDLVKGAMLAASAAGMKELYFVCRDERIITMAQHHGFEQLPWPVLRLKL